jgi:glycerol-3-phosphate dehydrogenase
LAFFYNSSIPKDSGVLKVWNNEDKDLMFAPTYKHRILIGMTTTMPHQRSEEHECQMLAALYVFSQQCWIKQESFAGVIGFFLAG